HIPLLAFFFLLFLSVSVAVPIGIVIKWIKPEARLRHPALRSPGQWLVWIFSISSLYFLVAFFRMMTDPEIYFRVPVALERLLTLPLLIAVLTIGLIIFTVSSWTRRRGKLIGRVSYTSFTITALLFLWWLNYWNLLLYSLRSS
ncbi:MAG: hypothetical protein ACM3Y8_09305, partial [Byssovorax cruenta]